MTGGVDDAIVAVVAAVDGADVGCAGAGAVAGGDVTDVGDDVATAQNWVRGQKYISSPLLAPPEPG